MEKISKRPTEDGLVFHMDFENGEAKDKINDSDGVIVDCEYLKENISIPYTTVPHRVPGRMFCLEHKDEGLVKNEHGKDVWAKGETTARNEKRFVHQMQQGKWDYK